MLPSVVALHSPPNVQSVIEPSEPGSAAPSRPGRKPRIEIEVTHEEKDRIAADARAAGIRKVGRYARLVLLKRRRRGDVPASRVIAFANRVIALADTGDVTAIRAHAEMVRSALQTEPAASSAAASR